MYINPFIFTIKINCEAVLVKYIIHQELGLRWSYQTGYSKIAKYVLFNVKKEKGEIFFLPQSNSKNFHFCVLTG